MLKLAFKKSPLFFTCEFSGFVQTFLMNQKPFIPKIFDGICTEYKSGFNTLIVKKEQEVPKGDLLLLWEVSPDEIDDFVAEIWPKFAHRTFGLLLYRGKAPPDLRTTLAELPDELMPFLALDLSDIQSPYEAFSLLSPARFEFFHLMVKGGIVARFPFARPLIGWEEQGSPYGFFGRSPPMPNLSRKIPLAIVHPAVQKFQACFDREIEKLEQKKVPFRVIHEEEITTHWEGVDTMMIFEEGLSSQSRRKIAGFLAAGGKLQTF